MKTELSNASVSPFESIRKVDENGTEYWSARELMTVLGYTEYRNFSSIIKKAIEACKNSGENVLNHFGQVNEMAEIGSKAKRKVENYYLTRYACYLTVQNADSSKEMVALGQTYFTVQTRKQELIEQQYEDEKRLLLRDELRNHNAKLADAAKDAGVVERVDYAAFQNFGYKGLYGGLGMGAIHSRKKLKPSEKILDHMGSTELAANLFRATQTEEKLRRDGTRGKENANKVHYDVGAKVRQTIKELGGTMPENLPVAPSINEVRKKYLLKKNNDIPGNIGINEGIQEAAAAGDESNDEK